MDNQENRNDAFTANQNSQGISPNPGMEPQNTTIQNDTTVLKNNAEVLQSPSNGPVIETIPLNNIVEQPSGSTQDAIETLEEVPFTETPTSNQNPTEDNFNAVPIPPDIPEEPKKKNKISNKTMLYVIVILFLIACVGFGVKFILTTAKSNATNKGIGLKEVKLELGEEVTEDLDKYATVTGYNKEECSIDKSKISTKKVGAYKFYVTCSGQTVEGTAIVDDTTKPEVITNEVLVVPNSEVTASDFIASCIDASACTYKFASEETVKTSLQTVGEYKIDIIVSDEYNNESTITANLIVSNEAPVRYLTCTSPSQDVDDIYATLTNSYKFGIDKENNISGIVKNSEFTFEEKEDYNKIKDSYSEEKGIHDVIGEATFNDGNKNITIKSKETLSELNKELNLTLNGDVNTLQMYMTILGYTCK